jgi:hypothetical protein
VKEFLEKLAGHFDQPVPVEEQVGDDASGERQRQPLVDGGTGQVWVRHNQKGSEDGQVEGESGFGRHWFTPNKKEFVI